VVEKVFQEEFNNTLPPVSNGEVAVRHFQEGIASGKNWYLALLEAIGLWTDEVETFQGRIYRYLIQGEAFDWLLLAERLCDTVNGLVPEEEKSALLFRGTPPLPLSSEEFRDLIGTKKYHQYLNYFYGITVEESLVQAVREEVRKERQANCCTRHDSDENEVFVRVYGDTLTALLRQFRKEQHTHLLSNSSLTEMKEFTYWCFKYRIRTCEKAKVASDTHKALEWLKKNGFRRHSEKGEDANQNGS
jgi:hypothetical protein